MTSDLEAACPNDQCPASEDDKLSKANAVANVSNVGFVVMGVGAVVALVGLFAGGSGGEDAAARFTAEGLVVRF